MTQPIILLKMRHFKYAVLILLVALTVANLAFGQKKKTTKKTVKKTTVKTTQPTQTPIPPTGEQAKTEAKKNERPTNENNPNDLLKNISNSVYFYEFSQPNFIVAKIFIEHDEAGKGKITFMKKDFDEEISDPLQLSAATLEKIKTAFQTLNFLASNENYQDDKRNYSHLGELKIKMKKDGRERIAAFNWTENENAKLLMEEYRKIAQQYVWIFDINLSRQNQPLEAPNLMNTLDSYIRRGEISDPPQMIPFLQKLSNDERIPLIARNHATRLIKEIEKKAEKNEK